MSVVLEMLSAELDDRRIQSIANHLGADRQQTQAAIEVALPTLVAAMSRASETNQGAQMMVHQMRQFGGGSLGDLLGSILGRSSPAPSGPPKQLPSEQGFDDILPPGFETSTNPNSNAIPTPRTPANSAPPPSGSNSSNRRDPFESSLGPGNELKPGRNPMPVNSDPSNRNAQTDEHAMDDMLGNIFGNKKQRVEDAIGKSSGLDFRKIGPLLMILAPMVLGAIRSRASSRESTKSLDPKDLSEMMRGERNSIEQKPGGSLIGRMLDQDGDGDFDLSDIIKFGYRSFFGRR